ncbi:chemotaxis response regulator protein-glutamate methylesterase [Peribacillus frigoritolerans]|uniref:protein-glutamate methylesterase/protein-glutamine glutaminase n=1 Tax=Peribacillus frigoritolerans TaxID=450367 RepID=UPI0021D12423|nr:chemotaxis response regulator protein-glutamate methylesterase [Peribacillus frigoritolerans]MCU6599798.1 chemotaxis response regulator protein-glutamate methylesterase [Peribacillus frigoritolerans]
MDKVKVLIVDDSAFMRKLISEFLAEDSRMEVIGTARNGIDAIEKIKTLKPDVVTLDVEMPIMDGLEALNRIMNECPTAVVMLSSTTKKGTENTFAAMNSGAFDFVAKPSGAISLDLHKIKKELHEKVMAASRANVHRLEKNARNIERSPSVWKKYSKIDSMLSSINEKNRRKWAYGYKKIIVIGTSTGGPRALQTVLTGLSEDIDAPILIVQHMPPGFTKSLATRLNSLCKIKVKEAEEGELIQKGVAYIAPGGYHLKVRKVGMTWAILLDQSELRNGHRPSVDVLIESVSEMNDYAKIAVIMTGMGMDGSKGLTKLKQKGPLKAIAESQETSIVFGMPKAAINTKLIDIIEDVEKIARAVISYC